MDENLEQGTNNNTDSAMVEHHRTRTHKTNKVRF